MAHVVQRSTLVERAVAFATERHSGQVRKYTGEPYVSHCLEVLEIVRSVGMGEVDQAVAVLHDTVEDTGTTLEELDRAFGDDVGSGVWELTDCQHRPETAYRAKGMKRSERKALDREHLSKISPSGQSIKLADVISNAGSIKSHDPDFWTKYQEELLMLVPLLTKGHPELRRRATDALRYGGVTMKRDSKQAVERVRSAINAAYVFNAPELKEAAAFIRSSKFLTSATPDEAAVAEAFANLLVNSATQKEKLLRAAFGGES